MAGKKDAAWWREYRARKAGIAAAVQSTGGSQDAAPLGVAATDHGGAERTASNRATNTGYRSARPFRLAAPDDDCIACDHDRNLHLGADGPVPCRFGGCRCAVFAGGF